MSPSGRAFAQTSFAFIDVETTGFDPKTDRIVELACVVTRGGRRVASYDTLVHPQRPIPATASAVHHLTDEHVRNAPPLADVLPEVRALVAECVVVAHNAAFDLGFLPGLRERPALCSMRFARRVLPEAPNYKNQVLRYHLGIRDDALASVAAHRALGDAIVTSLVFAACVERYLRDGGADDVGAAIARIAAPLVVPALRFGRHRGVPISGVPADYLRWVLGDCRSANDDERHTARCELERRAGVARDAAPAA